MQHFSQIALFIFICRNERDVTTGVHSSAILEGDTARYITVHVQRMKVGNLAYSTVQTTLSYLILLPRLKRRKTDHFNFIPERHILAVPHAK